MTHYTYWKRAADLVAAGLLLAVTLPLCLPIALLLWITQGRPIFYRQQRVGRGGRPFTLYKFRTMHDGHHHGPVDLPVAKAAAAEHRVTPLGRLLRRTALDELPQLINVLKGEMSLVGPRPLPVDDLEHPGWLEYVDAPERARRLDWLTRRHEVTPGLTGLWQITPNPADDFDNWIASDLAYLDRRSPGCDLGILLRTPGALLRGRRQSPQHPGHTAQQVP